MHDLREVLKLPEAKKGFVLLPKRWVVEGFDTVDIQDARALLEELGG